jgi:hypothetical protein
MTRIAPSLRSILLLNMILACALVPVFAHAQQQQSVPSVRQPALADDADGLNSPPRDPEQARMLREMSKDRNAQRQKEIVADTDHLMDLVKQLKDAVDKSNKNELSLSVVNTAGEIEKLAKSVKDKMRDGQ